MSTLITEIRYFDDIMQDKIVESWENETEEERKLREEDNVYYEA